MFKKVIIYGLIFTTFILSLNLLTSCNQTIEYKDGVDITVSNELLPYLKYEGELPKLHFAYDGTLRVIKGLATNKVSFAENNHYDFSNAFAKHLAQFVTTSKVTSVSDQKYDKNKAKFGKEELPIDPPNIYSQEVMEVIWQNGARYSYHYRTFMSNGVRYYIYPYTNNITITLEQPLMVTKGTDKNNLYLLSLPYDTIYIVSGNLTIKALTRSDTYYDENYYKFAFPSFLNDLEIETKKQRIKDWYLDYCNGQENEQTFTFTYLGNTFELFFEGEVGFGIKLHNQD